MGEKIPHDDRYERGSNAIDRIADGCKILWGIYLEVQNRDRANDQAEAVETAPAQGEKLLTLQELAKRLGRTTHTIEDWEKDFGFPALRAHPKADPLYDWREVIEWMKRHRDHKNNRVEDRGNGKIASAPSNGTRPQAKLR